MCKVNFKSLWTVLLLSMSLMAGAQEICNNGIDDDGDMLVDLNDDECGCSEVMPLTSVTGSLCTNNLNLNLTVDDASGYQWYRDGVALVGQTGRAIVLSETLPDVEGDYEVVATTATGCVISEPFEVELLEFSTYLGVETICMGDTIIFGPFFLTTEGTFSFKTPAFQPGLGFGCDSLVTLDVIVQQDEKYIEADNACEGTDYIFGTQVLTQSGTYEESFMSSAGCDSIVQLTLTFAPLDPIVIEQTICRGDSYTFRDLTETEPGMYPTNSVSPEGCDTTFILDLTVVEPVFYDTIATICLGGQVEIAGDIYDAPGSFDVPLVAASGCDSILTVTITEMPVDEYAFEETICRGAIFIYGDINATESGEYTTIISTPGAVCDSMITFDLTVIEPTPEEERFTICEGEEFEWRGEVYDTEGIYNITESTAGDCDIEHQLNLTVLPTVFEDRPASICAGGSVEIEGTVFDTPGTFEIELKTDEGCDRIVVVTVSEDEAEVFEFNENICRGEIYIYGDIEATTSGTYETLIVTPGVCDSMILVELTVDEPTPMVQNETICQGLTIEWNGEVYNETGSYEFLVTEFGECDEAFVLELEVTAPEVVFESRSLCLNQFPFDFQDLKIERGGFYTTVISMPGECDVEYQLEVDELMMSESFMDDNFCPGDTYILHDIEATTAGTYTTTIPNSVGCDSTITVNLLARTIATSEEPMEVCPGEIVMWNGMEISTEGDHMVTLTDQFGCDSIATLVLSFNTLLTFDMAFEICEGEIFTDYGLSETEEGDYEVLLSSGVGCDSLINIALKVNPVSAASIDTTICNGEVLELHDIVATTEGTYTTMVPGGNSFRCDSMLTVNLIVVSHENSEDPQEICEGETHEFGGTEYSETGRYDFTFTSTEGCDSMVSLLLNVIPLGRRTEEVLICPGDQFEFNDIVTTEAGTFETRLINSQGCDSLITVIVEMDDPDGLLELGQDTTINIGSEIDLIPEFISPSLTDFEWVDENGNVIGEESELFAFSPVEDTWVELFATNEHGCAVSERINVDVELIIDIYVPNVITPNIETADKYFTVGANESVVGIKELYIYDRWGELMFTDSHDGNLNTYLGWDGTYKNSTVLQGVYAYLIVFDIIDGSEVQKKGSLTVLK